MINIAAQLGIHYQDAFADLWSEYDFEYDPKYCLYSSKRIYKNLHNLGLICETVDCITSEAASDVLAMVSVNDLLLIGMDTYYIPWSQVYQHFHEFHYFFIQKMSDELYNAFDPTYDKKEIKINKKHISDHAFAISRGLKGKQKEIKADLIREAKELLRIIPSMKEEVLSDLQKYADLGEKEAKSVIQRINVMIDNRYLFRQYLQQVADRFSQVQTYFGGEFFAGWEGVKNGLYKAYVVKDKPPVIAEVCALFCDLMEAELNIAARIIENEEN